MIKTISVKNFKCYKKQSFDLSNLTVFCGNNSVGKSTAIQALLLALQNEFSNELELSGDFLNIGSYSDIHNRNAESDSLSIQLITDKGSISWGYDDNEFDREKREKIEEMPLPLLSSYPHDEKNISHSLKKAYFGNLQYLCAERWGPRNNYPYSTKRRNPDWLGIQGEFVPQFLSEMISKIPLQEKDPRKHKNAKSNLLSENLYEWMGEISPGVFIRANAIKNADISTNEFVFNGEKYRPVNVGFGLSYALPIVISLLMAKSGGLVIIENPEAHLHPKGQSYLGRLIALTAQAGVQVIIETHSDHLLNGIRVAIRLNDGYEKETAKVFFISSGDEQSDVDEIIIGKKGELSSWPEGFFDQQAIDVKILMKGRES